MEKHQIQLIVEQTEDGYVGYQVGLEGAVVAEDDSYEETLRDLLSAIQFHFETFGVSIKAN